MFLTPWDSFLYPDSTAAMVPPGIMGGCFATEGWEEAMGIALTYATIGMFVAVIGGMWIINWGAKKGYTRQKMDSSYVEKKDITGILPAEQRKPAAMGISNPSVIDPMAFQMMIVGTIIAVSHFLREAIIMVFPFWERIPLYTMCLIMGAIIGVGISKTKYNQYIDRGSMKRISGVALEYAIAMNVATIKLSVLATYLVPILLDCCRNHSSNSYDLYRTGKKVVWKRLV